MNNGWTSERKAKQALAIQRWKPWQQATGPKTPKGKATVSRNAFKGGERPSLRHSNTALRRFFKDSKDFMGEMR